MRSTECPSSFDYLYHNNTLCDGGCLAGYDAKRYAFTFSVLSKID